MNSSQLAAKAKSKVLLTASAAVALIAAFSLAATAHAPAASSGGLNAGGEKQSTAKTRAQKGSAKYKRLWGKTSSRNKRWARRTAECESGRNPKAIGGGGLYRGAFQFMKATWRSSPKSPGGDPVRYPYRTQAVVAVALKKRDGRGHWPHCG